MFRSIASALNSLCQRVWYEDHWLVPLLLPFSYLYRIVVLWRRRLYESGRLCRHHLPVPVIIIGNLSVGGTGKTPLVIWIARWLVEHGYRPGVLCRGYGGCGKLWPQQVRPDSDTATVGDEAVLLARRCGCPVVADSQRVRAGLSMLEHYDVNIIVCDDGLQHLALLPDVSVSLTDGERRYGNGHCLPAGPLREPLQEANRVDMQVCTEGACRRGEFPMKIDGDQLQSLTDDRRVTTSDWCGREVHAVAGIGNPERFYHTLTRLGLRIIRHSFPDHYRYRPGELNFSDDRPVVMTEKDAVKYEPYAQSRHWCLLVQADMGQVFMRRLLSLLEKKQPRIRANPADAIHE